MAYFLWPYSPRSWRGPTAVRSLPPTTTPLPKYLVPTLPRFFRPALSAVLLALSLAAPRAAFAQTLDTSYAIGLLHAQSHPYNFTGRVFDYDNTAFGSGTLIRRHTVLTAGHVVYDPTAGFITNASFTRGLYEDYSLSQQQVIAAAALSGYQAAVIADTNTSLDAFSRDLGYVLIHDAPVDSDWGNFSNDPTTLSDPTNQFFVLGYPGVTFDGRTMAYIVPSSTYVQIGSSTDSGLYTNAGYIPEAGESGGPIYVYNGETRLVVAETTGGNGDTTGEFNESLVRGIDIVAGRFLEQAEYTGGLIKKVKIKGPRVVTHGTTVRYTALPQFVVPNVGSTTANVTTTRYTEIKLVTSTPGTSTTPAVTIRKVNNTEFDVTFATTVRPKSTTTLQAFYSKSNPVDKSTITITVN